MIRTTRRYFVKFSMSLFTKLGIKKIWYIPIRRRGRGGGGGRISD